MDGGKDLFRAGKGFSLVQKVYWTTAKTVSSWEKGYSPKEEAHSAFAETFSEAPKGFSSWEKALWIPKNVLADGEKVWGDQGKGVLDGPKGLSTREKVLGAAAEPSWTAQKVSSEEE